jgi:hypothetical protein
LFDHLGLFQKSKMKLRNCIPPIQRPMLSPPWSLPPSR